MPFLLGPLLCGAHMTTWLLWTAFGTCETSLSHIGYQLPFLGSRQAHDWHHSAVHLGMYDLGSSLLDDLFGTNVRRFRPRIPGPSSAFVGASRRRLAVPAASR